VAALQATGNFEVTVDGTLVHSKKTKGDGFIDSEAKYQKVVDALAKAGGKGTGKITVPSTMPGLSDFVMWALLLVGIYLYMSGK
jgi:polygalacturonase